MPRSVRLSKEARSDLQGVRRWFRQPGSGVSAAVRLERLEFSILRIADAPYACLAGPLPGTRLLVSQRHRVLYRIFPDTGDTLTAGDVFLVRIYGPGQSDT